MPVVLQEGAVQLETQPAKLSPVRRGCGFGHGFLILFLAEAQLPRDPTDSLTRLKAVMNNAEKAS